MLLEIKSKNKDIELAGLIDQCCEVANGQNEYVEQCVFPETKLQRKIATDTVQDGKASQSINMLSGHMEGMYVYNLKAHEVLCLNFKFEDGTTVFKNFFKI